MHLHYAIQHGFLKPIQIQNKEIITFVRHTNPSGVHAG